MKKIVPNSKKHQSIKKVQEIKDGNKPLVINVASAYGADIAKLKSISFKVLIKCTNEIFTVKKFPISMKIRDLKGLLEFVCGIPFNLQRLSYLDDGMITNF
jgi:hypothetical protein